MQNVHTRRQSATMGAWRTGAIACLLGMAAAASQAQTAQPSTSECVVGGSVAAGGRPLPGVAIVVNADGREIAATSSDTNGNYLARVPGPGRYELHADLAAFAPASREVTLTSDACAVRVDIAISLLSRTTAAPPATAPAAPEAAASAPATPAAAPGATSRPRPANGAGAGRGFQPLALVADQSSLETAAATAGEPPEGLDVPLPPGFSPDAPTEAVATTGAQGQLNEPLLFGDRAREGFGGPDAPGRPGEGGFGPGGGAGGFGAGGFGAGGPGAGGVGPGGGGLQGGGPFAMGGLRGNDRVRGSATYTLGGSMLDASPYPLNGASVQPSYVQQNYGATVGGPLKIPGLFNGGTKTSFFLNFSGAHSSNPVDAYSTVPTEAERAGDFSGLSTILIDPATGAPFDGNRIPDSRIDPAARSLLAYTPAPNLPGNTQNFHYSTTVTSTTNNLNGRFIHLFGPEPSPGQRGGRGGMFGGGFGGPFGGPASQANARQGPARSVLTIGLNYRESTAMQSSSFPTVGGTTSTTGWNIPVTYLYSSRRLTNILTVGFNRNRSGSQNLYAFTQDVAGDAGILGVSTDPFDWGVPNLSFTNIASMRDRNSSRRIDQRIEVNDTVLRLWGRHAFRFGGGFRALRLDSESDPNARGSFVFTGLYTSAAVAGRPGSGTGLDFADFLLGDAQQASVQYGPGLVQLRGRSYNLFAQDAWRARGNLTFNLGVRYEYVSPFTEVSGHLVNLDVTPDFTAAAPVEAGGVGPYTGQFPSSLVNPDRNNVAPRVGVAWRPQPRTIVRAGYGINYNLGSYGSIAQQMAAQPPFAVSATTLGTRTAPLALVDAFSQIASETTTNSYGIDKTYQLGLVQIWNVDVQRELAHNITASIGYTGTRGSDLDIQRAPNRGPAGPRIPGVQPFIWESSQGHSILHALSARVRKRLTGGLSAGASYTLSKGLDNASSIGGGTVVVAQNDQDLAAEWGRSSFDRRHSFAGDYLFELPFGKGRRWLDHGGPAAEILGNWRWDGTVSIQSGLPFTARVLGNYLDVSRGVNGTLRANYDGSPIAIADPTIARFFNTAAFSVPPQGEFGDAGRNTITGPGTFNVNMGLSKDVTFDRNRGLTIRVQANNVLNTAQFASIDTVVNSPTFGQVIAVRPMRTVQIIMRVRF